MRRLRYLLMLLLALHALGMAGLDASCNYAKNGGGIFGDACTGDGIQKYKYNGKELDCTHGLDTYDYGARMYDAALPVWDRPDPLAHKYYHVSPYVYCGNNPVNRMDSDGMEVHPADSAAFSVILNTINQNEREFVVLNKAGSIDYATMQSHKSESGNYNALMALAGSDLIFNIYIQEHYTFMDNNGIIKENQTLSYCEPDNEFVDLSFNSPSGLTTGETGKYGVTLLPEKGTSGVNSCDKAAHIYIHPSLSKLGKAEALSHELYGHGYLFNQYRDRNISKHDYRNTKIEHNMLLRERIKKARMETVSHFK